MEEKQAVGYMFWRNNVIDKNPLSAYQRPVIPFDLSCELDKGISRSEALTFFTSELNSKHYSQYGVWASIPCAGTIGPAIGIIFVAVGLGCFQNKLRHNIPACFCSWNWVMLLILLYPAIFYWDLMSTYNKLGSDLDESYVKKYTQCTDSQT